MLCKESLNSDDNNSTYINKTSKHLSPLFTDHKKENNDICHLKSRSWFGTAPKTAWLKHNGSRDKENHVFILWKSIFERNSNKIYFRTIAYK